MVLNLKLVLIITSFVFVVNTQTFNPVMDIGVYPNHTKDGINAITCGLRYTPAVHRISYKPECFRHNYSDQVLIEFSDLRFDRSVPTQPQGRIFKGQDAESGEGPWAVYIGWKPLKIDRFSVLACTGSLITYEWVLTTAHCPFFADPDEGRYLIIAGPTSNAGWGYTVGIHYRENAKWINHPFYDNPSLATNSTNQAELDNIKSFHDMALIKLDTPFLEEQVSGLYLINPVCLPSRNRSRGFPFKGTNFGYGLKESSTFSSRPTRLQKAEHNVSMDTGQYFYRADHNSQKDEPKLCRGDGGSGLVYYMDEYKTKAVIVGTAHGGGQAKEWWDPRTDCLAVEDIEDDYSLYVPTYRLIDWILDTIAIN